MWLILGLFCCEGEHMWTRNGFLRILCEVAHAVWVPPAPPEPQLVLWGIANTR